MGINPDGGEAGSSAGERRPHPFWLRPRPFCKRPHPFMGRPHPFRKSVTCQAPCSDWISLILPTDDAYSLSWERNTSIPVLYLCLCLRGERMFFKSLIKMKGISKDKIYL